MQITDQTMIDRQVNNASEVNDGFFTFLNAGEYAVEIVKYSGDDKTESGFEYAYELYHITLYKAKKEWFDLTNLENFPADLGDRYEFVECAYINSAAEVMHKLNGYILAHSFIG